MSGGRFDYKQHVIGDIADQIEDCIYKGVYHEGSDPIRPDVRAKFVEGAELLRRAEVYAQRIDWILSGDDGEDTFLERLRADLARKENLHGE